MSDEIKESCEIMCRTIDEAIKASVNVDSEIGTKRETSFGKRYIKFALIFKVDEFDWALEVFTDWFGSYMHYAQYVSGEGQQYPDINKQVPLTCFWRQKPKMLVEKGMVRLSMRLLILRETRDGH